MNYGKFREPAPNINNEIEALKDNLSKGTITESQYRQELSGLLAARCMYIARTNGAYTIPKPKRLKKQNITQLREVYNAETTRSFVDELNEKTENTEE